MKSRKETSPRSPAAAPDWWSTSAADPAPAHDSSPEDPFPTLRPSVDLYTHTHEQQINKHSALYFLSAQRQEFKEPRAGQHQHVSHRNPDTRATQGASHTS